VNQIIANPFYHQGLFDLGDSIINESSEPDSTTRRSHLTVGNASDSGSYEG